jgi:predicted aldo/keto reductase-like oxidoreductase
MSVSAVEVLMDRRSFVASMMSSLAGNALAAEAMPMVTLGRTGMKVSRFVLGGYHLRVGGEENGVAMIHRAIDLGVNFFDSAAHYHNGASDECYGKALEGGLRQKVFVMSKAQLRTRDEAMQQLENTLRRMKTDYLDLWQCHEVSRQDEVDKILAPGGSLEAFVAAKKQGKVRHIGFTGHADPAVHQRLMDSFDGWETVQCPVNLVDPHYLSFIDGVLPKARKKGLGILAMKSNAMGAITKAGIANIEECLRFSWSQDIDVLVSGPETIAQMEQNIAVLKSLKPMSRAEVKTILARTSKGQVGTAVERYKRKEA